MTLQEAIEARHSVRKYTDQPLSAELVQRINDELATINQQQGLNFQLVTEEPRAFKGFASYGNFQGVRNYIVLAGKKGDDEKIGYWSEHLMLLAQTLRLNTCFVGLTYKKVADAFTLNEGEKVKGMIAIGYGETQGVDHKRKTLDQISNVSPSTPDWFRRGVIAARLAPTAVNQQKFYLEYHADNTVEAKTTFSLMGGAYTKIDLGIVKYNFELAAGKENFKWE